MKAIRQDRNGVKVRVYRDETGSVVEADCECFGHPQRSHSTEHCKLFKAQQKERPQAAR